MTIYRCWDHSIIMFPFLSIKCELIPLYVEVQKCILFNNSNNNKITEGDGINICDNLVSK